MIKKVPLLVGILVLCAVTNIYGRQKNLNTQALKEISRFAKDICSTVSPEGSNESLGISGQGTAKVGKLIQKLANLGIEGAIKYNKSEYNGVLRKDLANVILDSNSCKQNMVKLLIGEFDVTDQFDNDFIYTKVTTHQGLEYALQSCKWLGEEILCEFIVTNPNSRRTLAVHKKDSLIQDEMSITYDATWVKIVGGKGEGALSTKKSIFKNKKVRVLIKYAGYTNGKNEIADLGLKSSQGLVYFSEIPLL